MRENVKRRQEFVKENELVVRRFGRPKNAALHLIFTLVALFQSFLHKTVKVFVQTKNNNNAKYKKKLQKYCILYK